MSPAPKTNAWITLSRLSCASRPPSRVTSSFVPAGSVAPISSTSLRTPAATDTVLASRVRVMDRLTFGLPLRTEMLLNSAKPSSTVATCPRRTSSLPRRRMTICSNSAGDSMRPTSRMLWSSSSPRTLPTGAVAFCARSAATTSVTETENSRSFSACSSTDSSRRSAPPTFTAATPGMARKRSASWSSARREISAWLCWVDESASCMIGCAAGSRRCSTGSRISSGSLWRTEPMALRTSSAASTMSLSKLKTSTSRALPSAAVARTSSTPAMPCSAFSMRFTTSRSVVSGEAPG